ncbi:MAG TPA: substrate-binding domain-containing protein [Acidimicrobiales bacterium]|nr:substrate-binding domain-containing protein [Acidimicrobiales bacterium]
MSAERARRGMRRSTPRLRRGRSWSRLLPGAALVASSMIVQARPASAAVEVKGAGSTWSSIAVGQWQADVALQGLNINYQASGSTTGRKFYYTGTSDFAVSEIPFQSAYVGTGQNVTTDEVALAAARPYVYLPIVAGGTSFLYNLSVNGQRVTDLKLSPTTIAKIFTGVIKDWSAPEITADDGRTFPAEPIVPVVRSDGSGTSAQFTAWMAKVTPGLWSDFCVKVGLGASCPPTSQYPLFDGAKAQQLSDGVANYVKAAYGKGSITYVEYGYAIAGTPFPVASVLNAAGYFTQPTAENVAIALLKARIKPDRTQVLDDVYTNPDPRAYPVSSYSYMIAPTTTAAPFTTEKGTALGKFILYFLCTGQQTAKRLGYSPLPRNLVEFGFDAVTQIPGAPAPPAIGDCANPTITGSFAPENVPPPPATDKKAGGATGDTGASGPAASASAASGGGPSAGGTNAAAAGATGTTRPGTGARTAKAAGSGSAATAGPGAGGPATRDAAVGLEGELAAPVGERRDDSAVEVNGAPISVDGTGPGGTLPFVMAALTVLLAVFLPALVGMRRPRSD